MNTNRQLPTHWKIQEIKDSDIQIIDGDRGKNYPKKSDFLDKGFCLFLNTGNIQNDKFVFNQCDFISEHKDQQLRKGKLKRNDIVLTTRGTVGNLAHYHQEIQFENIRINSGMIILRCEKEVFSYFLYQLLKSGMMKNQYMLYASGAAQPQLPIRDFNRIKILLPPLKEQQQIAAILTAYDELIETNNQRIATLEQIAQQIYKEWFVRMRFPNWENTPFHHGIPEGWERKKIGDISFVGRGSSPRPITDDKYFKGGTIPWVKIADATASFIFINSTKQYVNNFGASFSRKLPKGSLIISASGSLGVPMILGTEACIHDGWMYFLNIPNNMKEFFYYTLICFRNYFESISYGAAIQNINTNIVKNFPFILPSQDILNEFQKIAQPVFSEIEILQEQNANLTKTRNLLLPRLISGKLTLKQAENSMP